jgi:hypothetical protein
MPHHQINGPNSSHIFVFCITMTEIRYLYGPVYIYIGLGLLLPQMTVLLIKIEQKPKDFLLTWKAHNDSNFCPQFICFLCSLIIRMPIIPQRWSCLYFRNQYFTLSLTVQVDLKGSTTQRYRSQSKLTWKVEQRNAIAHSSSWLQR